MAAKNPVISQAARKRAHERLDTYADQIGQAAGLVNTKRELGEFSGQAQLHLDRMTHQREGYILALRDLLPERTVDVIVGGGDDADEGDE